MKRSAGVTAHTVLGGNFDPTPNDNTVMVDVTVRDLGH